jgi:hypothetical protein
MKETRMKKAFLIDLAVVLVISVGAAAFGIAMLIAIAD